MIDLIKVTGEFSQADCKELFNMPSRENLFRMHSVDSDGFAEFRQVKESKSKPRTRIEYVKVEDSIFHLKPDFDAGELYSKHKKKDKYYMINTEIWLVSAMHNDNVYRRVEREVAWIDELYQFLDDKGIHHYTSKSDTVIREDEFEINSVMRISEFKSMCHLVASLTDKPE